MKEIKEYGELLKRAESVGVGVHLDSGFVVVALSSDGDSRKQAPVVSELGARSAGIRRFLINRAATERAQKLLGKSVWIKDVGLGRLIGVQDRNEMFVVEVATGGRDGRPAQFQIPIDNVLLFAQPSLQWRQHFRDVS